MRSVVKDRKSRNLDVESCASFSKGKETELPEIGTQSMLCRVYIVVDTYIKYKKKVAKDEKILHHITWREEWNLLARKASEA